MVLLSGDGSAYVVCALLLLFFFFFLFFHRIKFSQTVVDARSFSPTLPIFHFLSIFSSFYFLFFPSSYSHLHFSSQFSLDEGEIKLQIKTRSSFGWFGTRVRETYTKCHSAAANQRIYQQSNYPEACIDYYCCVQNLIIKRIKKKPKMLQINIFINLMHSIYFYITSFPPN